MREQVIILLVEPEKTKMPGTKASGRPGGNPEIKKYGFKTTRDEPLSQQINIRIAKSMEVKLKELPRWQDLVREAIEEKLNQVDRLDEAS
jgi:hypothetical protein